MAMLNANRQFNINTAKKAKSAEKLSSGYRINRAADDAAGLSISEKMRWMIRGLNQGTENAQDGASWVQIGDGSLEETHAMLHRMTELAIKASNETNTDADRALMQAEFNQLQKEIDRLTDATQFNTKDIFKEHENPFYQIEGATKWPQSMPHTVRNGENDLVMTYRQRESDPPKTATITVPAGEYTTRELIDEIDTALEKAGLLKEGVYFEYTPTGLCNLNLEGGEKIDEVSGGLSYLLFDNSGGGDLGALIGTTVYKTWNSGLQIDDERNDKISFKLIDPEGEKVPQPVALDLLPRNDGSGVFKTKLELMQALRDALVAQGYNPVRDDGTVDEVVKVDHHGENIMLYSDRYIVSEFKGNMFEIDDNAEFTSIFYDNIHHVDKVTYLPAQFQGAGVLQVSRPGYGIYDQQASVFHFREGDNNLLVLNPNDTGEITLDLTNLDGKGQSLDGMNMKQVCSALNDELERRYGVDKAPVKFEAVMPDPYEKVTDNQGKTSWIGYTAMRITTKEAEPGKKVGVNVAKSTAYTTLFTAKSVTYYHNDATFGGTDGTPDSLAKLMGGKDLTKGLKVTDDNNNFHISLSRTDGQPGLSADITLENSVTGAYSLSALTAQIQKQLNEAFKDAPPEMKDSQDRVIVVDNDGTHITLTGATKKIQTIEVGPLAGDTGYEDIFPDVKLTPKWAPENQQRVETITMKPPAEGAKITADGKVTIPSAHDGNLVVYVDGYKKEPVNTDFNLYTGAPNGDGKWDSLEALEEYINENLKPTVTPIPFATVDEKGKKDTVTPPTTQTGKGDTDTNVPSNYSALGHSSWSGEGQGSGGELLSTSGPTVELQKKLSPSADNPFTFTSLDFTITTHNNQEQPCSVSLNKEYTDLDTLQRDLQTAVNTAVGKDPTQIGGVEVKKISMRDGSQTLAFTVNAGGLEDPGRLVGTETKLSLDTSSGFLKDLHTTKTRAILTVGGTEKKNGSYYTQIRPVNSSFTPSENASLNFTVETPTSSKSVTVNLAKGTLYGRDDLRTAINNQLQAEGYSADYDSSGRLVITADEEHAGIGHNITLDGNSSGLKFLFGYQNPTDQSYSYENGHAATDKIDLPIQKEFTLESGKNFKIKVDGTEYDITLDAGDYGWASDKKDIAKEIANKVNAKAGKAVLDVDKTYLDWEHKIHFTTASQDAWNEATQTGSRIEVSYNNDKNSAMQTIFGSRQTAGVKAEFASTGDPNAPYALKLDRIIDPGAPDPTNAVNRSIKVTSDDVDQKGHSRTYQGGSFLYSDKNEAKPESEEGHESTMHSYMQGVSLAGRLNQNGKVEINQYNNNLSFYYTENYGAGSVSSTLISADVLNPGEESVEFTVEELKDRLQQKLNAATGGVQKFNVKVQDDGIRVETENAGQKYRIYPKSTASSYPYNPKGDFYDKILCSSKTDTDWKGIAWDNAGTINGEVYAVGRQDVKNNEVKIQKDGNDTLSLEFTVPGWPNQPEILQMKLDPGYYKGDALVQQIQGKLDEALEKAGLPKGIIEAGIGTVTDSVQIVGSINDRALTFKLSDKVKGPDMGAYGIEAIGGTAAFSVFYATDGDLARAYIKGGKDISQGIEIREGATDFSVDVDGVTYELELTAGQYTADELVEHLNTLFKDYQPEKVPLKAVNDEGHLKLMHNRYGRHKISNLKGRVKEQLFFAEKGAKEAEESIHLRLSSVSGDWTEIERPWMNTLFLGVNSLTISKYKYAQKAIGRLKEAVTKTSNVRSYFGSKQNQLESTIRNNENKAENTTAAESRIRDADFSREAVENSIHNILGQTGAAMMAQAKQNTQLATQLLS